MRLECCDLCIARLCRGLLRSFLHSRSRGRMDTISSLVIAFLYRLIDACCWLRYNGESALYVFHKCYTFPNFLTPTHNHQRTSGTHVTYFRYTSIQFTLYIQNSRYFLVLTTPGPESSIVLIGGDEPPKGARLAYRLWGLGTGVPSAYLSFRFSTEEL